MKKKNNIPKIIHYCWFGGNPLPELAVKCINSWKKHCPDYEIIEWNESNFDLQQNTYIKEAFAAKKWAFITDYVRLYALLKYGGVYMDTDVELIKPIDSFLVHDAFSGFEKIDNVPTGIMACKKKFRLFQELLDFYKDKHFILPDGSLDTTTNTVIITQICLDKGLKLNNRFQIIDGFALYPKDYFCPKDYDSGEIILTDNTVAIHHFSGSWLTNEDKKILKFRNFTVSKFGKTLGNFLTFIYAFPFRVVKRIKRILNRQK